MVDVKKQIEEQLAFFLKDRLKPSKLMIKIGIDGTPVGSFSIPNFVFTIIKDEDLCKSAN